MRDLATHAAYAYAINEAEDAGVLGWKNDKEQTFS
jgi:hypothetical protein